MTDRDPLERLWETTAAALEPQYREKKAYEELERRYREKVMREKLAESDASEDERMSEQTENDLAALLRWRRAHPDDESFSFRKIADHLGIAKSTVERRWRRMLTRPG